MTSTGPLAGRIYYERPSRENLSTTIEQPASARLSSEIPENSPEAIVDQYVKLGRPVEAISSARNVDRSSSSIAYNGEPTVDESVNFGRPVEASSSDRNANRRSSIEYNGEPIIDERKHFGWWDEYGDDPSDSEREEVETIDHSIYGDIADEHWQMHDDDEFQLVDITESINKKLAKRQSHHRDANLARADSEQHVYQIPDQSLTSTDLSKVTTRSSYVSQKSEQDLVRKDHRWYHWLLFQGRNIPPVPKERQVCPEYRANIFSILTWNWMSPIMTKGYQRPLEYQDLWTVNPNRSTQVLTAKMTAAFRKRVAAGNRRPLFGALFDTFKFEFILGGVCQFFASVIQVINPFILRYLITFAGEAYYAQLYNRTGPPIGHGVGLVFAITILQFLQSSCTNQFLYRGMVNGGQARAVLICAIFDKSLTISQRARAGDKALDQQKDDLPSSIEAGSKQEQQWRKRRERLKKKQEKRKQKAFAKAKKGGPKAMMELMQANASGWGNGRIINLMSVDTYRIDQASGMFHMIWTSPISILVTLVLLLINISYSALAGFALLVLSMPVLGKAISSLFNRRKKINKITDQRVSLTQEILSAVRFVKYFGWEESFLARIQELRAKEIRSIQFLLSIRNGINAISMSMPIFASMLAFITYALTSHSLNPAYIFSSLALFNSLRLPLNLLPMVIGQVVDAASSAERVEEFLLSEDAKDESTWDYENKNAIDMKEASFTWEQASDKSGQMGLGGIAAMAQGANPAQLAKLRQLAQSGQLAAQLAKANPQLQKQPPQKQQDPPDTPSTTGPKPTMFEKVFSVGLGTKKAKAERNKVEDEKRKSLQGPPPLPGLAAGKPGAFAAGAATNAKPFAIQDLSFTAGRNELVAVIGGVGSGKSSFLAALAGDMRKTSGEVTLGATRALCPQYAWIQNTSVRENILFGKEMDQSWYDSVINACALRPDLGMLPDGDLTEIGERGITVSGGQKQRLNIARAIYYDADIVLMDDPLSAVDAHVGRHIMDHAICGLLRNKCRILATHQLWVLNRCDKIVWMADGHIKAVDTFDNLMANDSDFATLIASNAQEEQREEEDNANEDQKAGEKKKIKKTKGKKDVSPGLMQAEERAVSAVSWGVYKAYFKATGSYWTVPLVLFLLIISQGATIVTSLWLSYWTSNRFHLSTGVYVGVYAALGTAQALLLFLFSVALSVFGTQASKVMLHRALHRVLRAPMSFFDTTPLGRITNRFSKDIDTMDNVLSDSIRFFSITMGMIVSVFILIIAYYYFFLVALVPLMILFIFSAGFYRASAREIKRHEAVLRSHVFARFSEGVSGISTIRAYGLEERFSYKIREVVDDMNSAYFLTFANQRWLSVRLDIIGNLLVFVVGILVVTSRFSIDPSTAGLVLSYILSIVQMIQFTVRQLAEVENNMNSTERIHYYGTEIEMEAAPHLAEVPKEWPQSGEINFQDVAMRYREGLPLVLQDFNLHVRGGERIGVVGRTGAGKSSIMSALFRLVEVADGSITIDGIDISTIGLVDLRSRLAIIPQDPTLFKGTVRSNLDPFNSYSDLELWSALRQADLVSDTDPSPGSPSAISDSSSDPLSMPSTSTGKEKDPGTTVPEKHVSVSPPGGGTSRIQLDSDVEEEGLNFSLGQRQLMALARALVRGARIIVCDEATSSVDMDTDAKIQRTMAQAFKGRTLLCIAHRLKTILSYDRIVVMDRGGIAEIGAPLELFNRGGIFRGMCDRSSITKEDF